MRRVDVEGNAIYVSGFSSSDTDDSSVWGNWASMGMTIIKFNSLPTTSGWPVATWATDPIYTLPSDDTNEFPEPFGFAVNSSAGLVGVTMLFSMPYNTGSLQEYSTETGELVQTLNQPLPGTDVIEGDFDNQDAAVAKNGCFWLEDAWYTRIVGLCP